MSDGPLDRVDLVWAHRALLWPNEDSPWLSPDLAQAETEDLAAELDRLARGGWEVVTVTPCGARLLIVLRRHEPLLGSDSKVWAKLEEGPLDG